MCGIVLAVIKTTATKELCRLARRDAHRAMLAMDLRGGDSWGVAVGSAACRIALRGLGTYARNGNLPILSPGDTLIGHTRFATKGGIVLQNAHPFSHKNFSVAHNGAFRAPIASDGWEDCDSYRLTGEIARSIESGADAALESGGYGTVAAIDGEHAFIWRSRGQAHAVIRPWGLLVASTPVADITGKVITIPDDETVYHLDASGKVTAWSRVVLTPDIWGTAGRALDHLWTWDESWPPTTKSGAAKRAKRASKGTLAAAWEQCLACSQTCDDVDDGLCGVCTARWASLYDNA